MSSEFYSTLEGGLVVDLDKHYALRRKAGTIHGVETLTGGFIVTKGYVDESALIPMSRWLAKSASFLHRLDNDGKDLALDNWLSTAQLATSEDVAVAWQVAGEIIFSVLLVSPFGPKKSTRVS